VLNKKEVIITIKKPTKVQKAWSLYFIWLHEVGFEMAENHHPSWDGYTKKVFSEIRELKKEMTEEEIKEFDNKTKPFKI